MSGAVEKAKRVRLFVSLAFLLGLCFSHAALHLHSASTLPEACSSSESLENLKPDPIDHDFINFALNIQDIEMSFFPIRFTQVEYPFNFFQRLISVSLFSRPPPVTHIS